MEMCVVRFVRVLTSENLLVIILKALLLSLQKKYPSEQNIVKTYMDCILQIALANIEEYGASIQMDEQTVCCSQMSYC